MNQRPTGLKVTKAITGFLQYKSAEGLSPVTVSGYDHDLKLWIEYQGDMDKVSPEWLLDKQLFESLVKKPRR